MILKCLYDTIITETKLIVPNNIKISLYNVSAIEDISL